ncbi:MAG: hypothetical protein FD156_1222 [Nitrospirae bacterium]|nr:MAG: hypothetical protein FD156_1222 [Nitrospirota bacterium]
MIPWAEIAKLLWKNKTSIGLICLIGLIWYQHNQIETLKLSVEKEHEKVLTERVENKKIKASIQVQNDAIEQWQKEGEKQKERVKETNRRIGELSAAYQKEIDALKNSSVIVQEITLPCNAIRKDGSQWMQEEWQKLFLQQ